MAVPLHSYVPVDEFLFAYVLPIGVASYFGGRAAGLIATVLSGVVAWYAILPPVFSFKLEPSAVPVLVVFILFGTVTALAVSHLRFLELARQAADAATGEGEAGLALALDAGQLGAWEWDVATGRVTWSSTLEEIHGLAPGGFEGTFEAYQRDIHPEDRERVLAAISEVLKDSAPTYEVEYRIIRPDGQVRWLAARARVVRDRAGTPMRMVGVCSDVTERRQVDEIQARLADFQSVTEGSLARLTGDELLRELIVRIRTILSADTVAVLLLDASGTELVARAAVGLEEEVKRGVRIPVGKGFAGRIAAQGRQIVLDDVQHAEVLNPLLRDKGLRGIIGVPLTVEGRVLGVLHVGSLRPRKFAAADVQLLQLAADRVALAIENARLYQAERQRAESLAALNQASATVHAAVRIEEVMQAIAETARRLCGGGQAFAAFFRSRGEPRPTEYREWQVAGAPRAAFEHLRELHVTPLFAPTFEGRGTVRADDIHTSPLFRGLPDGHVPVASYLAVPVTGRGEQVLGAVLVGHPEPGRFDDQVQTQIESLARQAALALENALLYEGEHRAAEALQRGLLPDRLPQIPGTAVATRYVPSSQAAAVGGDWYDIFTLPGGLAGIAIGDVAGHGVGAAALMGQMRMIVRAYMLDGHPPDGVLARLNRVVSSQDMITLITMVYDPASGELTYANAGHPPPLIVDQNGGVRFLEGSSPPVAGGPYRYRAHPDRIPAGSTIILYTDGLVERRTSISEGLERLKAVAQKTSEATVEQAAATIVTEMLQVDPNPDDVAVLVLRHVPLSERTFRIVVPAEPASLSIVRRALRQWLGVAGAGPDAVFDLVIAVGEATTNVVEHAYGAAEGTVEVEAERRGEQILVWVRDKGAWRAIRSHRRGLGLVFMKHLTDSIEVVRRPEGTTVAMTRNIRRPHKEDVRHAPAG